MELEDSPILRTERLLIRNLAMSDKMDVFLYRSLPAIYNFQSFKPKELKDVEIFLRSLAKKINVPNTWFQMAICLLSNNQLIGDIGLHFLENNNQVELGYTIDPHFQGKGFALEAVSSVIGFIFSDLGKHRVVASVDPKNLKSISLLNKLGFSREAYFRKSIFMDGEWLDDCFYALLKEEWNYL
jgi:RimJ/RimL family protein N-acetyltransferase